MEGALFEILDIGKNEVFKSRERKKGISGGEKKCELNAVLFLPANGEFMKTLIESRVVF